MQLKTCLAMPTQALRKWIETQHPKLSSPNLGGNGAWYWPARNSTIHGCVVAHIDTVWDRDRGKKHWPVIYHDTKARVLWSPNGLGADDRAGVALAIRLHRATGCAVLLCDGEESGGRGASAAVGNVELRRALRQHDYLLGLDRRGIGNYACYCGEPSSFRSWLNSFGLREVWGTFSDTSILARCLAIPAGNLSVGYYDEHHLSEHLKLDHWHAAFHVAARVLRTVPPFDWRDWNPTMLRPKASAYIRPNAQRDFFGPIDSTRWDTYHDNR